jgi:outer membrane protein TolC
MNIKKTVFLLTMAAIISTFTFAETVDLETVRNMALANSSELANLGLSAQSTALKEKAKVFTYLPSLTLGAKASMNLWGAQSSGAAEGAATTSVLAEGAAAPVLLDSLSAKVTLGVTEKVSLWDGGKNRVQKSIDAISSEITRQEAQTAFFQVLDDADAAYYGVLQAQAALDTAEASLESAVLALSTAEIRQANGMISVGDYLQALATKESREVARNQARQSLTLSRVKLQNLTGQPVDPAELDFSVYDPLIEHLAALDDQATDGLYTRFLNAVVANSPSLAKAVLQNQKAEETVSKAAKSSMPSVSASFSTGLEYSFLNDGGLKLSAGTFSISAIIPLDFWVTANSVAQKKILQEQEAINYRNTEASLFIEIQTALLKIIAQAETVLSSRRAYDSSSRSFDYTLESFTLAKSSVADLSTAAASASSATNQLVRAEYAFILGLSKLRSLGAFSEDAEVTALLLSV